VDEEGRFGGPERRIIQVAKSLEKFNVETVVVFPTSDAARFANEVEKLGVTSVQLDITRLSKERSTARRYIWRFFIEVWMLRKCFKKNSCQLVHVNGAYQFKTALAAKLSGLPVVWHLNNTKADSIVRWLFYLLAPFSASGFIVAGKRVYDYYLNNNKLSERPICEIHAPVDLDVFNPDLYAAKASTEEVVVLSVSGINPVKGVEYYIELADLIVREKSNVNFVLTGAKLESQKEYAEKIDRMIRSSALTAENFNQLGLVEGVPKLLAQADICVFTSVAEASPTAVWEAMAMGKAIVSTDVGSVSQHIENGVSGFIVPVGDVELLKEKTLFLIDDAEKRKSFGQAARAAACEKLDVEEAARLHDSIYREIIDVKL
jgi:glycosyltransferase involved in cell wall biosynthesis